MITQLELKTRWQKVLKVAPEAEEEESTAILCENDWVRILAVRNKDTPEKKRIEVEVSLPPESIANSSNDLSGLEVRNFVQNLIKHLEYLLHLADAGLTLGVISRDGLWTAYLELGNSPPESLFKVLIPPSV